MTDETRSRTELADDNARLRADNSDLLIRLAQARLTNDILEQTIQAMEQPSDNPDPETVDDRTRVYQSKR